MDTNLRKRLRKLRHVPQVTDDKLRRVLKSDREPSPEEAAEAAELIRQARAEIDRLKEPQPERL